MCADIEGLSFLYRVVVQWCVCGRRRYVGLVSHRSAMRRLLQQQFIDDVLNTGLLLYASRTWLSEVFHLVIIKDLFTSVVTADTQVLNTLLSGNSRLLSLSVYSCVVA